MIENSLDRDFQKEIEEQQAEVGKAIDRLVALRVEWQMHKEQIDSDSPEWLKPEYVKIRTITQAILNALEHNRLNGVKLSEFEPYLKSQKLPFHRPTVSATLGRLKRDEKVIRTSGGIWKLKTYANKIEENKTA